MMDFKDNFAPLLCIFIQIRPFFKTWFKIIPFFMLLSIFYGIIPEKDISLAKFTRVVDYA